MIEMLTDPTNILSAIVAIVVFATIVTLTAPMLSSNGLESRLKSVANRREELRRRSRESLTQKGGGTLRHVDEGMYKNVVERLQLSKLLEDPKVVDKLAQAGFRGPKPVSTFYFFRFVMPFAFAALAAFYLYVVNGFGLLPVQKLAAIFAFLTLGYYAPNLYIQNVAQKRRESIVAALTDAVELMLL